MGVVPFVLLIVLNSLMLRSLVKQRRSENAANLMLCNAKEVSLAKVNMNRSEMGGLKLFSSFLPDIPHNRLHFYRVPLGEVDPKPVRARPSCHGWQALMAAVGGVRDPHSTLPHDTQQLNKLLHLLRKTFQHHTKGMSLIRLYPTTSSVSYIPLREMAESVQKAKSPFATVSSMGMGSVSWIQYRICTVNVAGDGGAGFGYVELNIWPIEVICGAALSFSPAFVSICQDVAV